MSGSGHLAGIGFGQDVEVKADAVPYCTGTQPQASACWKAAAFWLASI